MGPGVPLPPPRSPPSRTYVGGAWEGSAARPDWASVVLGTAALVMAGEAAPGRLLAPALSSRERERERRYEHGRKLELERRKAREERGASRPPKADVQRENETTYDYLERLYFEKMGRAGGRRGNESREAAYARGKREASGPSAATGPPVKRVVNYGVHMEAVGFTKVLNVHERVSIKVDGMRDPEVRDHLHVLYKENKRNELLKYVTATRSDVVDRRFIEDLDNKNVERLCRFERWAQDLFVRCFHVKSDVRNVNAHVGTVLEHLRRCVERGVTPEEGQRLALMVEGGGEVSMKECVGPWNVPLRETVSVFPHR